MRKIASAVIMSTFFILMLTPVWADGRVTADPNAGHNTAARLKDSDTPDNDARLSKKVTYEARHKTVSAILSELNEATGVTLKAGYNDADWQVRDRKMNIFAKDATLATIMNSIARVMKFRWKVTEKSGAITYRLYMDRKSLLDAENARLRDEQRFEEEQAAKRQRSLVELGKAQSLSPQDLAKLKETNPYIYMTATSDIGKSMGAFLRSVPSAVEALASGQPMTFSGSSLSEAGRQGMIQAMQSMAKMQADFMGRKGANLPPDFMSNINQATISINSTLELTKSQPMGGMLLGDIQIRCGNSNYGIPFLDPDSNFTKLIGKLLVKAQEEDRPASEVFKDAQGEFMKVIMSDFKADNSGEPLIEHSEDPALKAKVKMDVKRNRLDDVQAALAAGSGLTIVSDSFSRGGLPASFAKEAELKDILEKIADNWHYNWDKRSSAIEMRDRNWYKKRAAQIPEAWLEEWRQIYKKTGTLDIDNLSEIAALAFEQISVNIGEDETLANGMVVAAVFGNRDLLRLYSALTSSQKTALFTDGGLNLAEVSPEQWPLVEKLINSRNGAFLQNTEATITFTATRKPVEKQFEYKFKMTTTDDMKPIEWQFTTPKYIEPTKKDDQSPKKDQKDQKDQPKPADPDQAK